MRRSAPCAVGHLAPSGTMRRCGPCAVTAALRRYARDGARPSGVLDVAYIVSRRRRVWSIPDSRFPIFVSLAVSINHVEKRYAGHVAVRELSLQVPRGAVYGLLGPNGAGKTTTIRMILNIIAPDQGSIEVLGQPNTSTAVLDRVGYLPEERGLYKKMQVRRLLKFLGALKGVSAKEADRRIDMWMDRLSLRKPEKDWGQAKVDELSRGMQQKVQFIGALLHDPELVILDEPFSGLDPIKIGRASCRERV